MAKRAFEQLCVMCQLHLFLDQETLLMVIHVLYPSNSSMDSCNVFYMELPLKEYLEVYECAIISRTFFPMRQMS